jgi:hypothetical protein
MQKLLQQITNYIYLGHSPSLISFADDGLPEIYDMLSLAIKTPQSYDPPIQLCTISFQYISQHTVEGIETEIANNLALNPKPYKTIIDAIKDGYDVIVVADDIDVIEDYAETVLAVDGIVKKYRNKVRLSILLRIQRCWKSSKAGYIRTLQFWMRLSITALAKTGTWNY